MMSVLPVNDIADQCKLARIHQRTIFGVVSLVGATLIAIIYDGETLLPIIGILGGMAGAVVGIKFKGVNK